MFSLQTFPLEQKRVLVRVDFNVPLNGKKISDALKWKKSDSFEGRMLLPYADAQAEKVLDYLKISPDIAGINNLS